MKNKEESDLKKFLDRKVNEFNNLSFIKDDPVCLPHLFSKKQDIEVADHLIEDLDKAIG